MDKDLRDSFQKFNYFFFSLYYLIELTDQTKTVWKVIR